MLGEDTELEGETGEEDWGVHVAEVIGGVDSGFVLVQLLAADDFDGREADEHEGAGPELGDEVLLATGLIPKTTEEGDAAEESCRKAAERDQKQVGQPPENEWRLFRGG